MVETSGIDLREIKLAFWPHQEIQKYEVLHGGLVHRSIKVQVDDSPFLLQQINHEVFTNPSVTISNIQVVTDHLTVDTDYDLKTPQLIKTKEGTGLLQDEKGNFWRCLTYIPHDDAFIFNNSPTTAYAVAEAFGKFGASLSNLESSSVMDTIPLFHDPASRIEKYKTAVQRMNGSLQSPEVREMLLRIDQNQDVAVKYAGLPLPWHIAHNDAKPSNVLFDHDGQPIAIIDLDTVMPGTPLLDFADLARSMANPVAEDDPNVAQIHFSADIYRALKSGFISGLNNKLSAFEIDHLSDAVAYMIYEQCLRFMTDFLQGNVYYKVSYSNHNLVRARNQMTLLESFLKQELS